MTGGLFLAAAQKPTTTTPSKNPVPTPTNGQESPASKPEARKNGNSTKESTKRQTDPES